MSAKLKADNRRVLVRLLVVAGLMFGFGYVMVPIYEKFCEVTGINNLLNPDDPIRNTQIDTSRKVIVEFDANIHGLPWSFKPGQSSIAVHPGELAHVVYRISNTRNHPVTGQAIPSYGPQLAAAHFKKMECFCFTHQTLGPGESRDIPVVFVIDPALPKDVNTITLSYTFFEVAGKVAEPAKTQPRPGA